MSKNVKTTIAAGEDLSASTCLYHAVALDDGQLAANGLEAGGILYNDPEDAQHATLGFLGEMRYAAGAAVSAGAKLTVTTSGWLITATAWAGLVGKAKADVSSGGTGVGLFDFSITTSM